MVRLAGTSSPTGNNRDRRHVCPVNTNGGLLGEAYIHGMNTLIEGVRQVRGTAVNQIPGVEHALVSSLSSSVIFSPM